MSNPLHTLNTLPSEQVEQLVKPLVAGDAPVCSVCKQAIDRWEFSTTGWAHVQPADWPLTRKMGCYNRPLPARAVPESKPIRHVPRVVVSSPAYQMDEIPSDADRWAENYIRTRARQSWLKDVLVEAYNAGFQAARATGGAR